MQICPYLFFDGNCIEAFNEYAKILNGKVAHIQTYGESPEGIPTPEGKDDKVMHAQVHFGDQIIMGSDSPMEYKEPTGMFVSAGFDSVERAAEVYKALADGGVERMPFAKTFWSEGFGMVTDRFGISWIVNTDEMPGTGE